MKTTLISATSVSAIALALVIHGIMQGDDSAPSHTREANQLPLPRTDAPKQVPVDSAHSPGTNPRLVSKARLSERRSQVVPGLQANSSGAGHSDRKAPVSSPGTSAYTEGKTTSTSPLLVGQNPLASRLTVLGQGENGPPISNISATPTDQPSDAASPTESRAEDPYQTPQPAVLVDMGDLASPDPTRDSALQEEAERVLTVLSEKPQSALNNLSRRAIVAESDLWFRQRYGGWQWSQHHIQAHHLAAGGR